MDYFLTFVSLFCIDIFYTYYLRAIADNKALVASVWSIVVTILGAFVVINYTTDHMMLIPAAIGAFCGTFVGMKLKKKAE
jgi:uncharacterized protein YebE (UPF0316 family)